MEREVNRVGFYSSYEFFKHTKTNVMAVALCHITLDNVANIIASKGETYTEEIQEIETVLWGIRTTGCTLCKDFEEKLMELRGLLISEFNMDNDGEGFEDI